jgi:hypothetical protein
MSGGMLRQIQARSKIDDNRFNGVASMRPEHRRHHDPLPIDQTDKIIGRIDCREASTRGDRPNRNHLVPIKALELPVDDETAGRFDPETCFNFARSPQRLYRSWRSVAVDNATAPMIA